MENETTESVTRFQIIYYREHRGYGESEKNTIVKKAETAARKDLELRYSNQIFIGGKNMRHERKMKQYGKAVHHFIKDNNIDVLDPSFFSLLDQYRIESLVQFGDERINSTPQYILQ